MADDPAATDAERQAFAARAADIMARHDLTEAVVRAAAGERPDPIILWDHPVSGVGGHGKARAYAAGAIAEAYGCEVCYRSNTAARSPRWVRIVGAASDLDALRMLLPVIAAHAEHAALAATRAHLARLRADGWPTAATPARESAAYRWPRCPTPPPKPRRRGKGGRHAPRTLTGPRRPASQPITATGEPDMNENSSRQDDVIVITLEVSLRPSIGKPDPRAARHWLANQIHDLTGVTVDAHHRVDEASEPDEPTADHEVTAIAFTQT
jgi:hypothetical protein